MWTPSSPRGACLLWKLADLMEANLQKLALEAGLPPGVLNVVVGVGETAAPR
jgi:acyl-CoA reductase-like NAD-dependent aldehyde dehydrogenase